MVGNVGELVIDTSQLVEVINNLKQAKQSLPKFFDMLVTQMGDTAIDYAIPLTRVRTGRLRSSYEMSEIEHVGSETKLNVFNYASEDGVRSYAIYNEFGTSFMAPRLMLSTAKEKIMQEYPEIAKTALIRLIRGDDVGRYTFKLN